METNKLANWRSHGVHIKKVQIVGAYPPSIYLSLLGVVTSTLNHLFPVGIKMRGLHR